MADYQSLLTRAVANLPHSVSADARQAIYERARKALLTQLKTLRPPLPESDIAKEAGALEKAIALVEAKYAGGEPMGEAEAQAAPTTATRAAEAATPAPQLAEASALRPEPKPAAPRTAASAAGGAPAAQSQLPARPAYAPARPPQSATAAPASPPARPQSQTSAPRVPTARGAGLAPAPKPPEPPSLNLSPSRPSARTTPAPPVAAAKSAGPFASAASLADVVPSATKDGGAPHAVLDRAGGGPDAGAAEQSVEAGRPAGSRVDADGLRPAVPAPVEPRKKSSWLWLALAALLGVVLSVAGAAIVMRQKPQDLAIIPPPEPAQEAAQSPQKIAQRAQPAGQEKPVAQAPTPTGEAQTSPPAPAAGEPQTSPQAEGVGKPQSDQQGSGSGTSAPPAPAGAPAAQEAPTALPSAARAAMLIASADNPQKPIVNLGSTVWSLIPAAQGQPATLAVKAEADIPDLKMHATMTLRKNTDPTLQATHTIDLKFSFAEGAPVTGFKDVGLPQMRKLDSTAAETLTSVKVKISDVYFLIALAKSDPDVARNLDLMQSRAWFDFPLLINDNRIAKLVFQKSEEGQAMLDKAIEAWKQ